MHGLEIKTWDRERLRSLRHGIVSGRYLGAGLPELVMKWDDTVLVTAANALES